VKNHTLVVTLRDRPGVLNRAVSMFRRRGYNIASLTVGHAEKPGISRMTLVVESEDVEQVAKQLYRLVDVLRVEDVTDEQVVEREMMLIRVKAAGAKRAELASLAEVFHCKVVDVDHTMMMLEMTGAPGKLDSFIDLVRPFGIVEMMRTGRITMVRGLSLSKDTSIRNEEPIFAAPVVEPARLAGAS
jgi:acetolactate synthase-1/3 small subunit